MDVSLDISMYIVQSRASPYILKYRYDSETSHKPCIKIVAVFRLLVGEHKSRSLIAPYFALMFSNYVVGSA